MWSDTFTAVSWSEIQWGNLTTDLDIAEIFPTHIRSQGVAWSLAGTFLSTLVYVEAAPTALANIQWKYYIIFVCLTAVNVVVFYFWCPEVSVARARPSTSPLWHTTYRILL